MGRLKTLLTPSVREDERLRLDLLADYREELRLAHQLRAHAEKAPYPHAGHMLREIATREERHAQRLREKILSLGGEVDDAPPKIKDGRNHWARLVLDLEDSQLKRKRFLEQAIRWHPEAPELAEFMRSLEQEELRHLTLLRALIARSDPQALD